MRAAAVSTEPLRPLLAAGTLSPPLHAVLRLRACFPQPGSPPLGRFVFVYSPEDEVTLSALVCSLRPQILVCPSSAAPAPTPEPREGGGPEPPTMSFVSQPLGCSRLFLKLGPLPQAVRMGTLCVGGVVMTVSKA